MAFVCDARKKMKVARYETRHIWLNFADCVRKAKALIE
jgi:hypothetical protein